MKAEPKLKIMSVSEFWKKGYLQELNRRFLHPLGLALSVEINNGVEKIGNILDFRSDPEGVYFDIKNKDFEEKAEFRNKARFIHDEHLKRSELRQKMLGFVIEFVPTDKLPESVHSPMREDEDV